MKNHRWALVMIKIPRFQTISIIYESLSGRRKVLTPASGHKQPITGSKTAMFGLLMDFDADQQLLGNDPKKEPPFSGVSRMYV
jgi:hypothetical protein